MCRLGARLFTATTAALLCGAPALAQPDVESVPPVNRGPAWTIIPEGRLQVEYDSNAFQQPGSGADNIAKLYGGTAFNYDFLHDELGIGSNTQMTGQYQMQLWRYADNSAFNVMQNIFTLQFAEKFELLGVKIMDAITPYVGGQLIYKVPTTTGVRRLDFNVLAGFNAVKVFGRDRFLAGGYQFSNLLPDVPQTAYSAHTLNVLYRMGLLPERIALTANYQLQFRVPQEATVEKNLRSMIGMSFQFTLYPGIVASLGADYTHQYAAPVNARLDYYTFSFNLGSDMFLSLP